MRDIPQELYGVPTERFEDCLNDFCDELGVFMFGEHNTMDEALVEEIPDKEKRNAMVINVLLNGITNYAAMQYCRSLADNGHSPMAVREMMLNHFAGVFDVNYVTKETKHEKMPEVQ